MLNSFTLNTNILNQSIMNKKLYFILLSLILFSGINLSAQSISILSPNGNEHYMRNTFAPHNITWTSTGVTNVKIEFSGDNGNTWNVITPSYTASLGWYSWTTPDVISINCIIKITSVENTSISDVSNASFNMVEKAIYFAEWTTTMGDFRAQLRGDLVPMTAQNFMNLAEKGFYSNLIFHRVIPNFMIQDGCPLGTGYGDPGYEFDDEFVPELNYNITGILGMANSGPNTNGSQYFITVAPYPSLNNGYSVFGKIVDGMDVVVNISKVPRDGNDKPLTPIYLTATIVEGTPSLNITTPVATGNYFANDAINIEWQSDFVSEVKIEYSLNNGTNWTTLTESIPSYNESFPWIIPSTLTTQGLLKITSLDNPSIYSQSSFEIREKPIQVTRFEMYNGVNPNSSNPENIVQPGKIVRMKVKIKNYYTQALNALSAQIQSTNSSFTVISGNLTFTSAAVGAEIWSNEAVEIQLSETMPVPSQYDFSISVSDANVIDVPWITKFSLPILEFNPMFFSIDDDNNVLGESNGNDDNVAQQGETIEVLPKIKNKSQKICYNVYGKLTCEAPFINIWNNIQGTPNMVYDTVIYNNLNPNRRNVICKSGS